MKKYTKLFWRKGVRNRIVTLINITGLSVGIAVFILILLWVSHEYSYDKYNSRLDQIYRIEIGGSLYMVSAIGPAFMNEFPEIERFVRFSGMGPRLLTTDENSVMADKTVLADSSIFDIFSFEFLEGNPGDALATPFSIVLTEPIARKLFGDSPALGKRISVDNRFETTVTGVIKELELTHMPVDAIASFVTLGKVMNQPDYLYSFGTTQFPTYFLLGKGVDAVKLTERMTAFTKELYSLHGGEKENFNCQLVPLRDIYFHEVWFPYHRHGNLKFVRIFMLVSLLTLTIALINFINLTIARSSSSEKEVGVKKVFGASRGELALQFIKESLFLCFVSSLIAILLVWLLIPEFNRLTGSNLILSDYLNLPSVIIFIAIILLTGITAGIYPAIRLSSFSPVSYFRKPGAESPSGMPFRTVLVIFQFTVAVILIISVLVVVKQLNYMKNYETGFTGKDVIVLSLDGNIQDNRDAFRNELMSLPGITEVSFTSAAPGTINNYEGFSYMGQEEGFPVFTIDPYFLPMLGIKIYEGRNFSPERPNDKGGVCILNREAVRLFKIDDPVGKFLKHRYYLTTIPRGEIEIIGVIDGYHYVSPKDSIGPALFCYGNWYNTACIGISGRDSQSVIGSIETVWNRFAPGYPFNYRYLDDFYSDQYRSEYTLSRILVYFALIAILIACLGLLGLTYFIAAGKTKETGIRKVFGAKGTDIILLMSSAFLKWIAISFIAGVPVAVIILEKWLSGFAYHTVISFWIIFLAALLILSLSLLTMIFHLTRVAVTNPATTLKYE